MSNLTKTGRVHLILKHEKWKNPLHYSAIICSRKILSITNGMMQTKTNKDGVGNQDLFTLIMFYPGCLFVVGLCCLHAHKELLQLYHHRKQCFTGSHRCQQMYVVTSTFMEAGKV